MAKAISKIMEVIFDIITVFAIAMLLSLGITKLATGTGSFFGYRPMYVMSASMEPTLMTGDFVLGRVADRDDIEIGGIYTYHAKDKNEMIVHRVYGETPDGKYIFWGDNNEAPDSIAVDAKDIAFEVIWYPNKNSRVHI